MYPDDEGGDPPFLGLRDVARRWTPETLTERTRMSAVIKKGKRLGLEPSRDSNLGSAQ
jgi:hypothetical protein